MQKQIFNDLKWNVPECKGWIKDQMNIQNEINSQVQDNHQIYAS